MVPRKSSAMDREYQDKWDRLLEKGASIRAKNGSWQILCLIGGKKKWRAIADIENDPESRHMLDYS